MEVSFSLAATERKVSIKGFFGVRYLLRGRPGAYVFYGESGRALYVGKSKDLASRVSTHIHRRSHVDVSTALQVGLFLTDTATHADMLETYLINALKPDLNVCKASFHEFLVDVDERLMEIEIEIDTLQNQIADELSFEDDEEEGYTEEEMLAYEMGVLASVARLQKQVNFLKRKAGHLKALGARSLRNVTGEEEKRAAAIRRKMAYLTGKGRAA